MWPIVLNLAHGLYIILFIFGPLYGTHKNMTYLATSTKLQNNQICVLQQPNENFHTLKGIWSNSVGLIVQDLICRLFLDMFNIGVKRSLVLERVCCSMPVLLDYDAWSDDQHIFEVGPWAFYKQLFSWNVTNGGWKTFLQLKFCSQKLDIIVATNKDV